MYKTLNLKFHTQTPVYNQILTREAVLSLAETSLGRTVRSGDDRSGDHIGIIRRAEVKPEVLEIHQESSKILDVEFQIEPIYSGISLPWETDKEIRLDFYASKYEVSQPSGGLPLIETFYEIKCHHLYVNFCENYSL